MKQKDKEELRQISQNLTDRLARIIEMIKQYEKIDGMNADEKTEYNRLRASVRDIAPVLRLLMNFFGAELLRNSIAYYYWIKEKAAGGDLLAMEIYNDMAPDFERFLIARIDKN